jgi:chaperonin GroES
MEGCVQIRPLHDRVVVRRIEAKEKTAGGIIILDTAQQKPQEGEVIAIGAEARNEKGELILLDVEVGDHVLFGKWSGTEVTVDGGNVLIVKESDILGILEQVSPLEKAA